MMKPALLALLLLCGDSLGCQKWTQNLQGVGLLTVTPSREAATGWNPELDAALPNDFFAQEASSLFVGLFEIDGYTPTDPTVPATGAQIELSNPNQSIDLCETMPEISGEFVHPPSDDAITLETANAESNNGSDLSKAKCSRTPWNYRYQTDHTLWIDWNEKIYELFFTTAAQEPAPDYQWSPQFEEETSLLESGLLHHPLNGALTLSWAPAETAEDHLPYISISRILYSGDTSSPTEFLNTENWSTDPHNPIYQSPPQDTQSLLYFLVAPNETEKTIEKLHFGQVGLYMLTVQNLNLSTHSSDNLSLGSGALSGSGTNYLIWVH
jgi:hypothetical protein